MSTPYIRINVNIHQRRMSLVIIAFCDYPGVRRITVPDDVPTLTEDVQLAIVRGLIADFPATEDGKRYDLLFRKPVGYTYCPNDDEAWELSPEGELLSKSTGPVASAGASVKIGNKTLSGGKAPWRNWPERPASDPTTS